MRQIVRYRFLSVPHKLTGEIRLTIEEGRSVAYTSTYDGGKSTNISIMPSIVIGIIRESERGEDGRFVRPPWNPNDSIPLTRYHIPLLLQEMKSIYRDMKIPEMYKYHGERLELNEKLAANARKVFIIGSVTVELVPVVIQRDETSSIEGIKMKFNNEASSVVLTLNEFYSFLFQLEHLQLDQIVTWMYDRYITSDAKEPYHRVPRKQPQVVDIEPKTRMESLISDIDIKNESKDTSSEFDEL